MASLRLRWIDDSWITDLTSAVKPPCSRAVVQGLSIRKITMLMAEVNMFSL